MEEEYTVLDALEDLDELERGDLDAESRSECIARIRALMLEIENASILIGDDQ